MTALVLASTSRSEDAGYLAIADVVAAADGIGADYRLIGGHMVTLLVAQFGVTGVPDRETNDADFGAEFSVVGDERLVDSLTNLGYTRPESSNRFIRPLPGGIEAVIDVLAPSYTGKHESNQLHGSLVVDEIPGLGYALGTAPAIVEFAAKLTSGGLVRATVRLPGALAALCLKLLAWNSRVGVKDAEDIWRTLEVGRAAGVDLKTGPSQPLLATHARCSSAL